MNKLYKLAVAFPLMACQSHLIRLRTWLSQRMLRKFQMALMKPWMT